MLQQLLLSPERLQHRRLDRRGLSLEVAAVFVCGLLGAAGLAYVAVQMMGAFETNPANLEFALIGTVARPVFALFLVWAAYTVVGHVLAGMRQGRGPITRLARTAAWAMLPLGVWYLLRSVVLVALYTVVVDVPADPDGLSAEDQVSAVMELGFEHPAYVAVVLLGVAFIAWSGLLLASGLEEAKGLSTDEARKIAAVPAGAYALYTLWTALQWAGVA